jgi:cystathionine beta-lyase/cystathionine gamma-synthase
LVEHPGLMTHAVVPKNEREKLGITENLIRVSVGLEDLEDIKADIKQALEAI